MNKSILALEGLSLRFGGLAALTDVSLNVQAGEVFGIIGPNGAGKSTAFNVITGIYQPSAGAVVLDGDIVAAGPDRSRRPFHHKPSQLARRGVARTFQNIRLFSSMSVLENVLVALQHRLRYGLINSVLRTSTFRDEEVAAKAEALRLLALLELDRVAAAPAQSLPYGEQRRLEIARALAVEPRLLLLDEPAAGMNQAEKHRLAELLHRICQTLSLTLITIEHDMRFVMGLCDRIAVLDHGVKIAEGTPDEVRANPAVIEAYLGEAPT